MTLIFSGYLSSAQNQEHDIVGTRVPVHGHLDVFLDGRLLDVFVVHQSTARESEHTCRLQRNGTGHWTNLRSDMYFSCFISSLAERNFFKIIEVLSKQAHNTIVEIRLVRKGLFICFN
jgi:hypothetical protein